MRVYLHRTRTRPNPANLMYGRGGDGTGKFPRSGSAGNLHDAPVFLDAKSPNKALNGGY